jgi:hypothetical protein
MNERELDYYEAGIKDANEARHIVFAARSKRYEALAMRDRLPVGKESSACLKAYDKGVAFEICRQTQLEY